MANQITEVRLLNVPLSTKQIHTFYFSNEFEQYTYFKTKTVYYENELSYQRKDGTIRYPKAYDDIDKCNYVMYKNSAYGDNKWIYAFITDKKYINDGLTEIYIQTDPIQTRLFEYEVGPSFVEREHVKQDVIGENTVPEGLETGEYICDERTSNKDFEQTSLIMGCTIDINNYTNFAQKWNPTKEFSPLYGGYYDGLYSGLSYFEVGDISKLKQVLKHIAYEGQEASVHSLFIAPTSFLPNLGDEEIEEGQFGKTIPHTFAYNSKPWNCGTRPSTLDGYEPRNKKLLTSPFCYMFVDNGGGTAVEYLYEKFKTDDIEFKVCSVLTPGMSIRAIPKNYNGLEENDSEGINLSKFATCSWTTDAYTSWLAQSAVNVGLTTVGAVASGVGTFLAVPTGGSSLAVGAAIAGGVAAVGGSLASANEKLSTPPQLHGNTNTGDLATSKRDVTFRAYKMCIRAEYAKIIDEFFDMYGYKVNRVKIPNRGHRENYWYTKLIDPNITGAIPMSELKEIQDCYSRGITFWRNPDKLGCYVDKDGNHLSNNPLKEI